MDRQYDVIIIGSGCGGAASAALAGCRGLKTLLLEKNKFFGGRAATVEKDGFKMDHGHLITRGAKGPHGDVLRMVNCQDLMPEYRTAGELRMLVHIFGDRWDLTESKLKGFFTMALPSILKSDYISMSDVPGTIRLLSKFLLLGEEQVKDLDQVDLQSYVSGFTGSRMIHYMLGAISAVGFGVLTDDISTGEFIRTLRGMMKTVNSGGGYPVTGEGVSAIPHSFLRAAARYDVDIEARTPAEKIVVDSTEVRGVYVNGELIEAPVVISNVGIKETTYRLVGKSYYDKDFIDYLEGLKYSYGGISLKYALDEPIVDFEFGGKVPLDFDRNMHDALQGRVPDEVSMMVVCTSNIDPRLAPPGRQVVVVISPGPPSEPDKIDWEPWVDNLKRQIEEDLIPGISKHTLFCINSTPDVIARENGRFLGDAIGVAQSMDQVGDKTPPCISPIRGLYHVGADVGSKGIATEMATQSAIDLFGELDKKGLTRDLHGAARHRISAVAVSR